MLNLIASVLVFTHTYMNIFIVTPFFYPFLNGVSVRVYKDAKALEQAGFKVSIISPYKGMSDIDCYQVGKPPVYLTPKVGQVLRQINQKQKIDIVISHSYISNLFSYLAARRLGAKFVCQIHGPEVEEIKATNKGVKKIIGLIGCWLDQFIIRRCDHLIVVEKELATWLKNKFKIKSDKITWIANYPDLEIFKPIDKPNDKFTVGYLGTLQPGRIQPLLDLAKELPSIRFKIVGSDKNIEEIKSLSNIEIISEPDNQKIPQVIADFDLGTIFSLTPKGMEHKGPPMKLFEYLACGLPVLAINLFELKNIIETNKLGLIVNEKNLNSGLKLIKDNYEQFQQNVQSFRQQMLVKYNWRIEKEKLIQLVKKLQS